VIYYFGEKKHTLRDLILVLETEIIKDELGGG